MAADSLGVDLAVDDAAVDPLDLPWIRLADLVGGAGDLAGDLIATLAADSSVDLVVHLPAFGLERDEDNGVALRFDRSFH